MSTSVGHLTDLTIETQFRLGTLIKFKYERNGEDSYSYSKITKIIPKIDDNYRVRLHFLTENEKFIAQEQIISVERKVDQ